MLMVSYRGHANLFEVGGFARLNQRGWAEGKPAQQAAHAVLGMAEREARQCEGHNSQPGTSASARAHVREHGPD